MIRIIVRTDEAGMAANVGGAVNTSFKTFEIAHIDLESFLAEDVGTYGQRQIVGCEICTLKLPELKP